MTTENPSNSSNTDVINLIRNLVYNFVYLISQHLRFFGEEVKEESVTIIKSVILIWISFCIAIIAIFFGGLLLIATFSLFVSMWWSLLFVTLLYFLVPTILVIYVLSQFKKICKKQKKFTDETAKTLEETKKWLEQLKS